ncbi:MAG: Gfo/Idh/MocA family oxidoreductase [Lentisphaeria bacterium]|nr:Gfo/Idh/MocA family oxidoreductase [Lentisphaeria bacterium]
MSAEANTPIRVALVGLGSYGRSHLSRLRGMAQNNRIKVVALSEMNQDNIALVRETLDELQIKVYEQADVMFKELSGKVDLVILPVGIAQHAPLTVAALECGHNVLVEKPLAGSVAEGEKIVEAEKRCPGFVAVGYQNAYTRECLEAKKLILSGVLGRVKKISGLAFMPRGTNYYTRNPWVGKLMVNGLPVYDSPLNNAAAHVVNLGLFFAGCGAVDQVARAVDAEGVLYRANDIESFDSAAVRWTTEENIPVNILVSHTVWDAYNPELTVECENGKIIYQLNGVTCATDNTGKVIYQSCAAAYSSELYDSVFKRISDPSAYIYTPEMALEQSAAIELMHKKIDIVQVPAESCQVRPDDGIIQVKLQPWYWRAAYIMGCLPAEIGWEIK